MMNNNETLKLSRLHNVMEEYSSLNGLSFNYGEEVELSLSGRESYPHLFLEEPILGSFDTSSGLHTLSFSILLLDKDTGNNNGEDYKDNTPKIDKFIGSLKELHSFLESQGYTSLTLDYLTLRDFGSDCTSGIRVELSLKDLKRC